MKFEHIIYEKKDGVMWLTLNRPEVLNALNRAMWRELNQAIDLADMRARNRRDSHALLFRDLREGAIAFL